MNQSTRAAMLGRLVSGPPVRKYRADGPGMIEEEQVLVGHVDAGPEHRALLEDYGIYMELAEFDPESGRWEGCLFSEPAADMLAELYDEDQFPFLFEAAPSQGGVEWLRARAEGVTERRELGLGVYLEPAAPEQLAELGMSPSWPLHPAGK